MAKNGSVKIGNTEMYYVAFGRGPKKLIVLPGLSDGLATVKGKAFVLSVPFKKFLKDYTVYMFSRKNDMPEGYTIRQMDADQAEAMKILGIDKACVMGVSQGGMVAQYLAIDYPKLIDKLILAVTAPSANEVVTDAVSTWIDMAKRGDHTSLMIDTAERMYSEKFLSQNRKFFPLLARFTKPKSYDRFFKNAYAILNFNAKDDLKNIKCPTLIIAGDDDKTVGNEAPHLLEEYILDSEAFIYEGLGHGAFEEANDFYDRLYEFCERK